MTHPTESATHALLQRYADLPLPPDAALIAPLCAATIDALIEAEHELQRLRARMVLTRRIGIVLGIIMTTHRIPEPQAERMLRNRGQGLTPEFRRLVDRIIGAGVAAE